MALQTFYILEVEACDGGYQCELRKDSMVTAAVQMDRIPGSAMPMAAVKVPGWKGLQYRGKLFLPADECPMVPERGMSVTVDFLGRKKYRVWAMAKENKFYGNP